MAVKQKQNKTKKVVRKNTLKLKLTFFQSRSPRRQQRGARQQARQWDSRATGSCPRTAPSRAAEALPHGRKPPQTGATASVWPKKDRRKAQGAAVSSLALQPVEELVPL